MQNDGTIIFNDKIRRISSNSVDHNDMDSISTRTDNDGFYTYENTSAPETLLNKKYDNNKSENFVNIYRYKFTEEFTNELYKFAKIHEYDNRKDFKEAWERWLEDKDDIVLDECRRLSNLGYDGSIKDKMYKSARYYFRKKIIVKKEPQKRGTYQGVQKDLLDKMDTHIKTNVYDENYKPSLGFHKFCQENVELLQEEVNILCKNGFTDVTEIKNKIKKTYKNRYFLLVNK